MATETRDEDLTSQVDGLTNQFTVSFPIEPGTLQVYRNGVKEGPGFFTELSTTTFETCDVLDANESLAVRAESPVGGFQLVSASGIDPGRC